MRWLITGATGMLGTDLVSVLRTAGHDVLAASKSDLDVCDSRAIDRVVGQARPDVVVNCAAWTSVDDAESHIGPAFALNATAPALLATACARFDVGMVQVSTDYVFGGSEPRSTPWDECEADLATPPKSVYGASKLAGEQEVLAALPSAYVVRTAWLYGHHGPNFVATMAAKAPQQARVVNDQWGQPTWTIDVATAIERLLSTNAPTGIYHATSSGHTTWHGLAAAVYEEVGADPAAVLETTSAQFQRPAPRPAWSVLGHRRWHEAGLAPIRDWRLALTAALPSVVAR